MPHYEFGELVRVEATKQWVFFPLTDTTSGIPMDTFLAKALKDLGAKGWRIGGVVNEVNPKREHRKVFYLQREIEDEN